MSGQHNSRNIIRIERVGQFAHSIAAQAAA
jgi:hypothetical protein